MRTPPRAGSNFQRLLRKRPEPRFVKYTGACKRGYGAGPVLFRCMINMRLPLWNRVVTQATDSQPRGKSLARTAEERAPRKMYGHGRALSSRLMKREAFGSIAARLDQAGNRRNS